MYVLECMYPYDLLVVTKSISRKRMQSNLAVHMLLAVASGASFTWLPVRERVHRPAPGRTAAKNLQDRFTACDPNHFSLCWEESNNRALHERAMVNSIESSIPHQSDVSLDDLRECWTRSVERSCQSTHHSSQTPCNLQCPSIPHSHTKEFNPETSDYYILEQTLLH